MQLFKALGTLLRWIFTPFIALLLVFEEWGWEPLAAAMQRLARLPLWARCERWIARLPRWGALVVMGAPALALFPVKLLALYFLGHGQAVIGTVVLIAAKLAGTALLARLFQITQPALLQFVWFAKWYPRWKAWKDQLMTQVRASAVWRTGRRIKAVLRRTARQFWQKFSK